MKDINLLPEESNFGEVEASSKSGGLTRIIVIGVTILFLVIISLVVPRIYLQTIDMKIESLQKDMQSEKYDYIRSINRGIAANTSLMNDKRAVINHVDQMFFPVNELLVTVRQTLPAGCVLSDVSYNAGSVTVRGTAQDPVAAAEYIKNIERLEIIKGTSINNISYQASGDTVDFNFSFNLLGKESD